MNKLQKLINKLNFEDAYNLVKRLDKNDPMLNPEEGLDPFLTSCYWNKHSLISALLDKGDDINKKDQTSGQTALFAAISKSGTNDKYTMTAHHLLNNGADPNICDKNSQSPLMQAIKNRNRLLIKKLMKQGADVNYLDKNGNTALKLSCVNNFGYSFDKLIKAGADVNIQDKDGKTALFYSKTREQTTELINNKADINIRDNEGKTVLDYTTKGSFKYNTIKEAINTLLLKEVKKEKEVITNAIKTLKTKKYKKLEFRK